MNYIVAYGQDDLFDLLFADLNESEDALIFKSRVSGPFGLIYKLAFTRYYKHVPLRTCFGRLAAWNEARQLLAAAKSFVSSEPTCMVLIPPYIDFEVYGLSRMLKKRQPGLKIAYYFADLVEKDWHKSWLLKNRPATVDLIATYDRGDAARYGLAQHALPYSLPAHVPEVAEPAYDVSFVGKAKDRLGKLLNICRTFEDAGLTCHFHVTEVEEKDQVEMPGMVYGGPMSYAEYLQIVYNSKCLLELVQEGGQDATVRTLEAVAFNKLLVSDSPLLATNSLYDERYMKQLTPDLDPTFVRETRTVSYGSKERISPREFLRFIAAELKSA